MGQLRKEFTTKDIKWVFNPPQASHMGGSWERKIGSVRRIMEAMREVVWGALGQGNTSLDWIIYSQ